MELVTTIPMNRGVRQFFDERASRWDTIVCPAHTERLSRIIPKLGIAPGARVLDMGCGSGALLPSLSRAVSQEGFIIEFDISHNMLIETWNKIRAGLHPAQCIQGDAGILPVSSTSFDWVVCNSCFPHFEAPRQAVIEMARILRQGGRLAICHTQSRATINAHHRMVGGIVGGHELPNDAAMAAILRQAGLLVLKMGDTCDGYLALAIKTRA